MKESNFQIPILLLVFNRLDTTKQVFQEIRKIRPEKLYVASDGPRENIPEDKTKIENVRNFLLENIDWECDIKTSFNKENVGCKYGPQNAITWFFKHVEAGIILEDDCVPSGSFFKFCNKLLIKYQDDFRVFGITGDNYLDNVEIDSSYYFSYFFTCCGWATWKSRWLKHLDTLDNFEELLDNKIIYTKLKNKIANKMIIKNAERAFNDEIDAWDFQWHLTSIINNGLVTVPQKNLIKNIGFGPDATHTTNEKRKIIPNYDINFPLIHPKVFIANEELDELNYLNLFGWIPATSKLTSLSYMYASIKTRVMNKLS